MTSCLALSIPYISSNDAVSSDDEDEEDFFFLASFPIESFDDNIPNGEEEED